jgi:hypothetical protein
MQIAKGLEQTAAIRTFVITILDQGVTRILRALQVIVRLNGQKQFREI